MLNILLICAGGMSTSVLAKRMEEQAAARGLEANIKAMGNASQNKYVKDADIVLVGPQIRYAFDKIKSQAGDTPVKVIEMRDYGMMDGAKVLDDALRTLGKLD